MGAWLHIRLADAGQAARLKPFLNALIRGQRPAESAAMAAQALQALESQAGGDHAIRRSLIDDLRGLAALPGDKKPRDRRMEMAHAVVDALVFVDYLPSWQAQDEGPHLTAITLADGSDGQLFAELTARCELFEQLASGSGAELIDADDLDFEDQADAPNATLATPAQLEELRGELERLHRDASFLVELSWERVDPKLARAAFERLRRLVARALAEGRTLAFDWSV